MSVKYHLMTGQFTDVENLARNKAKRLNDFTPAELRAQEVSWVMGMLPKDTTLTRADVADFVSRFHGCDCGDTAHTP